MNATITTGQTKPGGMDMHGDHPQAPTNIRLAFPQTIRSEHRLETSLNPICVFSKGKKAKKAPFKRATLETEAYS